MPPTAASPPAVATKSRRANLGRIALGLAIAVLVASFIAFTIDLAATPYPPSVSEWPVHPLVIFILMGAGLLFPLVLGARAITTEQGRREGIAAIKVSVLPELLAIAIIAVVAYAAVTP
jgi:uncharacterized integral membrane protein